MSPSNGTTRSTAASAASDGHPIVERVERAVVAFAEPLHRCVGVDRDDERRAERARLFEVGHVAAMQKVEHAVGHHQRPRQAARCAPARPRAWRPWRMNGAPGPAQTCCDPSYRPVVEDLDDAHHIRRRGGDLARGIAFRPGDDTHQIDDAALGDDLHDVGRELVRLDHARLDLRRDVRVVGARGQVGVRRRRPARCARAHLLGVLREVADAGPDALVRNFAGQQDDAVVARDVEVDAVAVLRVGLLRRS